MKKGWIGSAAPICVFIVIMLLCGVAVPIKGLAGLLISVCVSAAAAAAAAAIIKSAASRDVTKKGAHEVSKDKNKAGGQKAEPSRGSEIDAIINEGKTAMKEMGRLYSSIESPEIRSRINELMYVSDKIVRDAIDDPSDVPQIKKFLNYYLPTTIKLLNAYDRMSDQGVRGENLSRSMDSIEKMLDTSIEAFKKHLDSLFANQAMDIEADINVMNQMLAREGFGGGGYDDIIHNAAVGGSAAAQDSQ